MSDRSRSAHGRRLIAAVAWLCLVALMMAACAQPGAAPPAAGPGPQAPSAPQEAAVTSGVQLPADAAAEQVLRINSGSTGAASFTFYPMTGGGDHQSWMPFLFVPPLYFDEDLNLQPGVFSEWRNNETFTEWVFTIDPRARFSDGSPITAADVKGTWEFMARPDSGHGRITQYIGNVEGFQAVRDLAADEISGLTVVDDSTLQVTLINADPVFHWRLATTHMNPLKVDLVRNDPDNFWLPENNPVYSGPYLLASYSADLQEAVMVPNPNWWMDEGPYLERIEIRFQPEPETLAIMLQNNQVDLSLTAAPLQLQSQFPDYFRPIKSFGFNTFWIAVTNPPTDEVDVRKALVLAVDHEAVVRAAYPEGNAEMVSQIIDPDLPCLDQENSWYPYDPEAAREALAASSYGGPENLPKLRVTPRGTDAAMGRAIEAVVEFWRQNLGITNVEIQQRPDGFGQDEPLINVSRDDVVIRFPDSATYMWVAASTNGPIAAADGDMLRGYSNPTIDALLTEALALSVDDPRRCELALEAQRLFMEDYPTIFFGIPQTTLNARDYVANYHKGPDVGVIAPWKIYLKNH